VSFTQSILYAQTAGGGPNDVSADHEFDMQQLSAPWDREAAARDIEALLRERCSAQRDEGDHPVPDNSVFLAAQVLSQLITKMPGNPQVEAGADGSLGLFWRTGQWVAYVDILSNDHIRAFLRGPENRDDRFAGAAAELLPTLLGELEAFFAAIPNEELTANSPVTQSLCLA
jgi:hypothetical protein